MKIKLKPKWHCRRNGGLFLGVRMDFPMHVLGESINKELGQWETWKQLSLSFGFLLFSVNVDCEYDHRHKIL